MRSGEMGGGRQKLDVAFRFNGFGFMPFLVGGGADELVVVVVEMDEVVGNDVVEEDEETEDCWGDRERFRD